MHIEDCAFLVPSSSDYNQVLWKTVRLYTLIQLPAEYCRMIKRHGGRKTRAIKCLPQQNYFTVLWLSDLIAETNGRYEENLPTKLDEFRKADNFPNDAFG